MNSGLCEHCLRVAYLVTDMTILLGMDEKATMDVQLAAIYHDIGKTQIPEQVLNKPGKITPGEYFIMKLHAEIGYRMIQCHTSPETAQMVLYHHEVKAQLKKRSFFSVGFTILYMEEEKP